MSYNGESFIKFYIFDQLLNSFYHIYERADWKIAVLPFQELQIQVNETVLACNAVVSDQNPSTQQIKAWPM